MSVLDPGTGRGDRRLYQQGDPSGGSDRMVNYGSRGVFFLRRDIAVYGSDRGVHRQDVSCDTAVAAVCGAKGLRTERKERNER